MQGEEYPFPVLQVLKSNKINGGTPDKERYRLLLSDGKFTISTAVIVLRPGDSTRVPTNFSIIKIGKCKMEKISVQGNGAM